VLLDNGVAEVEVTDLDVRGKFDDAEGFENNVIHATKIC